MGQSGLVVGLRDLSICSWVFHVHGFVENSKKWPRHFIRNSSPDQKWSFHSLISARTSTGVGKVFPACCSATAFMDATCVRKKGLVAFSRAIVEGTVGRFLERCSITSRRRS